MKNTVYTVIAVLLMATLCLPAAAQTWTLDNWYAGPDDDRGNGNLIRDIEFRNNNQVFFAKWDRLYKWDLDLRRLWWWDFGGIDGEVWQVEVPRGDSSVVIHGRGDEIHIRDADDFSLITSTNPPGGWVQTLDVDRPRLYLAVVTRPHNFGKNAWTYWITYDIWGGNGWQFQEKDRGGGNYGDTDYKRDIAIHPDRANDDGYPYHYAVNVDTERIWENRGTGSGDVYISPYWDPFDQIAITDRYPGGTRLAALDSQNIIHVWNWSGDHLFTFNSSEGYAAHDEILEFTHNGELLVTAYGRWVRFWDVSTQAEDHSFWVDAMDDDESIRSLAFSDDGKKMALGSDNGTAYIYRWTGGSAPAAPAQEVEPAQPTALLSNYPNPFNPETWIPYQLSEAAEVTVTIHSSDGKLVRELELGQVSAGVYSDKDRAAYWDGRNAAGEPVASGVYFYTLQAGDFKATRKMVIRK